MKISAFDILKCLFEPDETVCFRVFDDKKRGVFPGMKLECQLGKYAQMEPVLAEHNSHDRGVFYVVNYGGQSDDAISRVNAQFVEMDDCSFEEQQKKIDAFLLPPSMIIKTKRSLHVYWFMDKKAEVGRFRKIQEQLVKQFDGDPVCVNESRVMRLPGFNHCKGDTPVMVECILFHPERKYSQDQLSELLPDAEEKRVIAQKGNEKGLDIICRGCDFIKHCKEDAAHLAEHDWYAMITNLAPFEGGVELIHQLSKPYPGYDAQATQKKINHYFESGTRPINCVTIAEKGYRCPKLATGECSCKSPASMCYMPLDAETIVQMISELTITNDPIKDTKTAQDFIKRWLYNQDEVTATAIINSAMREHFHFKTDFLRPLLQHYKRCAKKHENASHIRKTSEDMGLPAWYTVGNYGVKFLPGILALSMSRDENVIYAADQHFLYNNGVYEELTEKQSLRMVQQKILPSETKMSQIVDAENQWELIIQKNIRDLNPNPYIINLKNGLFNVLEGSLSGHTPEYLSTVQLGVKYDPKADCPRFKLFLMEAMGGDAEQVKLLQEMLGYFLIPVQSAQKCFVMVGVASAGKSVLLRVLNEILLGRQNVSNVSWQSLNERFKTAELFGKLANIFADLPTKNIDDNGIFKALVGEDYLTVEKKNKNPFSFQSYARLLFSCNTIPKNYGDKSDGFYRRLIIVRFNHAVPEDKRDPHLIEKFRAEADGIFMFALEGLKRLMDNNFVFSETEANRAELQQYREDSDSVLSFVNECCELDDNQEKPSSVGSTELYNAYKRYCEECGLKPFSQKMCIQQIISSFDTVTRDIDRLGKRRILKGIRLTEVLG